MSLVPISPHGLIIALLQLAALIGLLAAARRWEQAYVAREISTRWIRPLLAVVLVAEYAILRVQPIRMGGDPFAYTLGIFDAFTFFALLVLLVPRIAARSSSLAHTPRAP